MRRLLLNSGLLKAKVWNACTRGIASESVVQSFQGTDRNSTLGQRWQLHENQILIAGVERQELELEKAGRGIIEPSRREKWEEIENYCHLNGVNRSAEQCRQRWQRLLLAFSKIKYWESCRPPGKSSFWLMKPSEKKAEGLSFSLDLETFNAIDLIQSRKEVTCTTADFSDAEAVSTESPSSEVNVQQQIMDDSKTHRETTVSIMDDQEAHAFNQASSAGLLNSTQEANSTDNDDRPAVFVNAINECLSYLKDLVHNSGEPFKAQTNRESGVDTCDKNAEIPEKAPSGE